MLQRAVQSGSLGQSSLRRTSVVPVNDRPFRQCHAPSLVALPDGRMVVAFFAGTCEKHPDTRVVTCVREGGKWLPPATAAKVSDEAHWNPVLFLDGDRLDLYFKVGEQIEEWKCWRSSFDAATGKWGDPEPYRHDAKDAGPCRNKPIRLSSGSLLVPSSSERVLRRELRESRHVPGRMVIAPVQVWNSFVDVESRAGEWRRGDIPYDFDRWGAETGLIQPAAWESSPGNVHLMLRSSVGRIFRSDSTDGGLTWSQAEDTGMPNPNSAVDVVRRGDGLLAMGHNPVEGEWARRSPLSLSFSTGDGRSWTEPFAVEWGDGSYSYPSVVALGGDRMAMAYSWNRYSIAYCEFDARLNGAFEDGRPDVTVSQEADGGSR